ncbi:kinase-like protein [Ramicandelaber brevisporus]|nr:kinase-like protein [Ramicandelaber brevisporus]
MTSQPDLLEAYAEDEEEGMVVNGWVLGRVIGRGGFSTVRIAELYDNEVQPPKLIPADELADNDDETCPRVMLEREIEIWKQVHDHPNVVRYYDVAYTMTATLLFVELCERGSVYDMIQREYPDGLPPRLLASLFTQLANTMAYLHDRIGIIHGDIKLENLLIADDGTLRITDFGLSEYAEAPKSSASNYLDAAAIPAGQRAVYPDMWAVGVVMYLMLTGRYPFSDMFSPRLVMKIQRGEYDKALINAAVERARSTSLSPDEAAYSQEAANLIDQLLVADPKKRCTVKDLVSSPLYICDFIATASSSSSSSSASH